MEASHEPVLLRETIDLLAPRPGEIFVDATLGGAGHAVEIAARIAPGGTLIGIDRDASVLARAKEKLEIPGCDVKAVHGNFENLGDT